MPIFQSAGSFEDWKADKHEIECETLAGQEENARLQRRKALADANVPIDFPKAGLALSGGGIRSATFSLGLLRELAAQGLLHRFDYLSTVSGGSYIGAYYAGLFARRRGMEGSADPQPLISAGDFLPSSSSAGDPFSEREGKARASLEWLRQSGRYLAPSGAGDYWYAMGLLVRNWLGLHLVIGSAMMLVALLAAGFRLLMFAHPWSNSPPPGILLAAPLLIFLLIPAGFHVIYAWGFWMTKRGQTHPLTIAQFGSVVIALAGIALTLSERARVTVFPGVAHVRESAAAVAFFALAGLAAMGISCLKAPRGIDDEATWDSRRKWLTSRLRWCAHGFVLILAAAIIDALAFQLFYLIFDEGAWPAVVPATIASVAAVVPAGRWLLARLVQLSGTVAASDTKSKPSFFTRERLLSFGAAVAAIVLITLVVGLWTVLAYRAVWPDLAASAMNAALCPAQDDGTLWRGCTTLNDGAWPAIITVWLSWTLIFTFLSLCIAFSPAFLNLSGLTSFYAGRLRRAYLGAGNENRLGLGTSEHGQTLTALDAWDTSDDIQLKDYFREGSAAPLHLINITLNETRGTGSHIVQRDRRGRNLVVSPGGIYCDSDASGKLYRIAFAGKDHEPLPLSSWIAISGAAFSTGLGSRTGFPTSQLAGLANVRLGYWWRARKGAANSITQADLLREFTGDFSGPNQKNWYLSDGGHFENTGAYELIRRRLPFIVVSDNGMDERFEYEDIANLVRKARIDFDCEIDFLDERRLDAMFQSNPARRPSFGTMVQIAGGKLNASAAQGAKSEQDEAEKGADTPHQTCGTDDRAVAAIARLKYRDAPPGTLLLIKPRLTGDGPADLIRYKAVNSGFPQQSTLDQFFDEAQWESYYHLGRLIGQAVFGGDGPSAPDPKPGSDWRPRSLETIF